MKPKSFLEYCIAEVKGMPWYLFVLYVIVLGIIAFVAVSSSAFMLSSGNAVTALVGAFFIVALIILVPLPFVTITYLAHSLYQPAQDNYIHRTYRARRLVMEREVKEILEALKAGRDPKVQLLHYIELAIATGYPLASLSAPFYDLLHKYKGIKAPKFTLYPSETYPLALHCTYQPPSAIEDIELEVRLTAA